jgi:PEP-CTERM motif
MKSKLLSLTVIIILLAFGTVHAIPNSAITLNTFNANLFGARSEFSQFQSYPGLYVNGELQNPACDEGFNVCFNFDKGNQQWSLLAEYSGWKDKNSFGYLNQSGDLNTVFSGFNSVGDKAFTDIASGTDIGLWLFSDLDMDGIADEYEPFLSSQREWNSTKYTRYDDYQYFYVYDVKKYKNTLSEYSFLNNHEDFHTTGNFDYLIYIDDSGVYSTDSDHNDMILGVTTTIPEPGTMILLGMGLASLGIAHRRKKI